MNIRHILIRSCTAALLAAGTAATAAWPTSASADPCAPLISDLVNWVNARPGNTVAFHWAMNYQANRRWTVNYGDGELGKGKAFATGGIGRPPFGTVPRLHFPSLSGSAKRTFSDVSYCRDPVPGTFCGVFQNFDIKRPETVALDIFSDGGVMVARQYGPTAATCYGTKFLTINYWDGFDSFTFVKQSAPIIH
jgi:hypothetical protein